MAIIGRPGSGGGTRIIGQPRVQPESGWDAAPYTLGTEAGPLGAVSVQGLDDLVDAIEHQRRRPDVIVTPGDDATRRWFVGWVNASTEQRDVVIRDVKSDRWVYLWGAWMHRGNITGDVYVLAMSEAELGAAPNGA